MYSGVTEFAEGDEVIGFVREEILRHDTYAEKASVPASSLVRKPRNANWAQAAELPLAGITAYQSIVHALKRWRFGMKETAPKLLIVNRTTGCQRSAARGSVWLELKR